MQARDFDPHSLRSTLPGAVRALHRELEAGRRVYVHCTAGLGRAPAVCIAYLYWFQHFQLQNVSPIPILTSLTAVPSVSDAASTEPPYTTGCTGAKLLLLKP